MYYGVVVLEKLMTDFISKLKYSDINTLELYQCILMIFVNPVQLVEASHCHNDNIYIYYCAFISLLLGFFSIFSLYKNKLFLKRLTSQTHWILCVVIVCLLVQGSSKSPFTIITFYSSQLICSMYCHWRISTEYFIRRKKWAT